MKQIKDFTNIQFTYDSREERDDHVLELESLGWICTGQVSRLKSSVSIHDAHNKDSREYFAELYMDNLIRG